MVGYHVVVLTVFLFSTVESYTLKKLGSFPISYPGFTTVYPRSSGEVDLLISTFNPIPFSTDTAQIVPGIGHYLNNVQSIKPALITSHVTWPNEVSGVPEHVFGRRMVAIPQGFLVPFKNDGSISLMDVSMTAPKGPYKITDDSSGKWFYHRVIWKDMDADGDDDAVTCRAREPIIGGHKEFELLWLENQGHLDRPWTSHVIGQGPDIFLRNATLMTPSGPKDCIITAQYFTQSLSVYWTDNATHSWTNLSQVHSRVIDNSIGGVFEVEVVDLNGDGKLDLLVSENGQIGALYGYEIPVDFRTGNFTRHTLAQGFGPRKSGTGKGAPGSPTAVFPYKNATQKVKPSILLSGDDEGTAFYLEPLSADASSWTYNLTTFLQASDGTVGQLSFADANGDGYQEVFVPSYSTNELFVYTFHP
ncbi:uncharacterized protein LOC132563824 [Ylistrum balloti]|uniref:uncharacterized protein LOC132563824 n=1 Tax=Ylistrum balloti TaxID=509963 RepID=UPI0029059A66|nr:uncharacterized protein LOC132563824 [Ylistrum balloti]